MKNADIRKYQHTCLANDIIAMGNQIYIEPMNYKGLQKGLKKRKLTKKADIKRKSVLENLLPIKHRQCLLQF